MNPGGRMSEMRAAVAGAGGRMGRAVIRLLAETEGASLVASIERTGSPHVGQDAGSVAEIAANGVIITDDLQAALGDADAVIDFSAPASTVALAQAAAEAGVVLVTGTTGLSAEDGAALNEAARSIPVVQAGNMSLGVNLLAQFVRQAARALDSSYDIEVVEMHHRHKVDAPSGTSLMFGAAAAEGRGVALADVAVRGRDGHTGERPEGAIGFAALRGGTVVGDHTVMFAGDGESIELTHRAFDRAIFARGALAAARWAIGRHPGRYSMADELGHSEDKNPD